MLVNHPLSLGANMKNEWKVHPGLPDRTGFMMCMAAVQERDCGMSSVNGLTSG